jgi:hypothetical protein
MSRPSQWSNWRSFVNDLGYSSRISQKPSNFDRVAASCFFCFRICVQKDIRLRSDLLSRTQRLYTIVRQVPRPFLVRFSIIVLTGAAIFLTLAIL